MDSGHSYPVAARLCPVVTIKILVAGGFGVGKHLAADPRFPPQETAVG